MAENVYFMDGVDFTEETFNAYMKKVMANDGYLVGEGSELEVIENTPAAMNVVVGTGKAWVRGVLYENTAAKTVTVDAADATYSRIDRIVVRLTWADDTVEAVYLKGTAAASPAAPALTQTSAVWELSLARILVTVGKTSIVTGDITDERNTTTCGQAACLLGSMHVEADGSLDAASKQIHNLANPSSNQDADTKAARDAAIAAGVTAVPGRFLGMTVIAVSGNFTTQAATKKIRVTAYGAGAGGAGIQGASSTTVSVGGSGGAGAKAVKVFTVTGSTDYACVIGAKGTGGASGNNDGTDGGNTTFTGPGSVVVTAGGGKKGKYDGTNGLGGTATNGDLNIPGQAGTPGAGALNTSAPTGASGGDSDVGAGGKPTNRGAGDGNDASGYAAGGGGGFGISTTPRAGGDGAPGLIIVEEFS